jgi:hypothetical protein
MDGVVSQRLLSSIHTQSPPIARKPAPKALIVISADGFSQSSGFFVPGL